MRMTVSQEYIDWKRNALSSPFTDWRTCVSCGDDVHVERWNLGFKLCLFCGENAAVSARASWCVVQPYGKGPYMLVTESSAHQTLLDTNQKAPRS
jgi:predicted RNA-binding Zn-ribbon protein involved in translation (DUF1610 family)